MAAHHQISAQPNNATTFACVTACAAILEASMSTLQEGQLLLERIREMGVHADVQNRHATTAACYGIEHLLELLQDRRRHLEELWLQRRIRLEQCLQLLLLDQEVGKVSAALGCYVSVSLSVCLSFIGLRYRPSLKARHCLHTTHCHALPLSDAEP